MSEFAANDCHRALSSRSMRAAILCIIASALGPVTALRLPMQTRRTALTKGVLISGAVAAAALPVPSARAETCMGKCSEDPERTARRIAIQSG